jgi:hypothetical protein
MCVFVLEDIIYAPQCLIVRGKGPFILGLGRLRESRLAPKLDPDLKSALGISP